MANQINVPFYGNNLLIVSHNNEPYTPMKQIVEGMGLNWAGQYTKLRANDKRWGVEIISIPSSSGDQDCTCLPLRKLPGWLMTIHANKVRPEIREKVLTYQNECDDVLWKYWTEGQVTNPKKRITSKTRFKSRDDLSFTKRNEDGNLINWVVSSRSGDWHEHYRIGEEWFSEVIELFRNNPKEAFYALEGASFYMMKYHGHGHEEGFYTSLVKWAMAGMLNHEALPKLPIDSYSDMDLSNESQAMFGFARSRTHHENDTFNETVKRTLNAMVAPNGCYVDTETLSLFVTLAIRKLNHRNEFYQSKKTGGFIKLEM